MRYFLFCVFFLFGLTASTQVTAPPESAQAGSVLILNARAHLGNGESIENAAIAFENGKITLVADATTIRIDRSAYTSIFDASGKDVYPGLIAMNSNLGLVEINAVRSTRDFRESGSMNPSVRALIAYNTDSHVTPTVRSNGVLVGQICPEGGRISGKSAVVHFDAWNWEDAALKEEDGIHLNWPSAMKWTGWAEGKPRRIKNDKYSESVQSMQHFFQEAKAYCTAETPQESNLKFNALRGLFEKKEKLYVHVGAAKQMQEAVLFAEKIEAEVVLIGAEEAYMITDFLKKHATPVVLYPTQSLPNRADEQIFQPYETPKMLHEAGVLFAISGEGSWQQRNLPFQAGQAVAFGLPYEAAVAAVTSSPAKIMGLDTLIGTIEEGKDATLIISEGDVFDMRSSTVIAAFIQGRSVDLDDKHKQLYRKFKAKYAEDKK